jgi:hypothetical protein
VSFLLEMNSSGTLDPAHVRSLAVLENFIGWDDTPTGSWPPPRISNDIVTEQALVFFVGQPSSIHFCSDPSSSSGSSFSSA